MHCGQTYLTASFSQLRYFCYFLISRRDGENNGFLAGVPLLPPPSRVVSRPSSLPLPFRTPATQARSGLGCGLSIRHCHCHWIMAPWFVFLHFFLVPLCWDAVSERQMLLFFVRGLIGLDKYLFQRVSLLPLLYHWIIFSFYYSPMSMLFQNKNN